MPHCPTGTLFLTLALLWAGCQSPPGEGPRVDESPLSDELVSAGVLDRDARIEVLSEGYWWSEGPVWVPDHAALLFSDVPRNTIYRWTQTSGVEPWLTPSGSTRGDGGEGSNGLTLDPAGRLVLAQHGDRRIGRLEAPLNRPAPDFSTVVDRYGDRAFNSPNDLVYGGDGTLYFTDPPYGLSAPEDTELGFNGVYRLSPSGSVTLIDSTLSRPNGIALSPDGRTLYVANSDPEAAIWVAYSVNEDGSTGQRRLFFDATRLVGEENPGLPDGLKVDVRGRLFATGPGGVLVFEPTGHYVGTIRTDGPTANVAFGGRDRSILFMTTNRYLTRIDTRTQGLGPL